MAFVTSSFTGTNGSDLADYTPELGGPWVHHPHANYTTTFTLESNRTTSTTGTSAYYATATPPSADYYAQADFYLHSATAQAIGVCVRMHETDDTMYIGRLNDGTSWTIRKIVASTQLTLGTSTNQLPTAGTSKTGKLVVEGDQLYFYVNGVLEIGPITDTAITAAGKAGVRNVGTSSATTGVHLDNFTASELEENLGTALFRGRNFPFFDDEEVNRFEFWPAVAAGAQNYTLPTTTGVFTLTGNSANLTEQKKLTADTGTFTETGNAANLLQGYLLPAVTGAFTLTGNATAFSRTRIMPAAIGSFVLTGNAVNFLKGTTLIVTPGSFTLTGQTANFLYSRRLITDIGTFTLTGNAATLTKSSASTLVASAGAFTLTGNAANLRQARVLTAQPGTFTFTGNIAGLLQGHLLASQSGSFALAGQAANFNISLSLSVTSGVFVLTGSDAGLRATRLLSAETSTFTLTGPDVVLLISAAASAVVGPLNVNLLNSGNLGTGISLGTTATSIDDGITGVEL